MTLKQRLLLIVPGALFLVAITAFEFGLRKGRETAPNPHAHAYKVLSEADLVKTLFAQNLDEREFPFSSVSRAASGHAIQPFDQTSEGPATLLAVIKSATTQSLRFHNSPDSPVRELGRINEASRYFEDSLRATLDAHPEISCTIPKTAEGREQRSGYPDLRVEHRPSKTVAYLDPKLFAESSRNSTLRTFYFEPQKGTSKITEDAHHLLLGISHDGKDGDWTFLGWELIDLASLQVRLKAEFQASNRDLYRDAARIASSTDTP